MLTLRAHSLAFDELIRTFQGRDEKRQYDLAVANRLWAAKGLSLDPDFLRITQTDYHAGIELADFIAGSEGARQRINGWVLDRTKKKIENFCRMDSLTQGLA